LLLVAPVASFSLLLADLVSLAILTSCFLLIITLAIYFSGVRSIEGPFSSALTDYIFESALLKDWLILKLYYWVNWSFWFCYWKVFEFIFSPAFEIDGSWSLLETCF